jgi:uncharacterized membrane protein
MERHRRSIAKAVSWRATGTIDTFVISLLLTGSARLAGGIASVEVFTKMVPYYLHERAWSRIAWGGEDGRGSVEDDLHGPGRRPAGHRPPPGGDPPGAVS